MTGGRGVSPGRFRLRNKPSGVANVKVVRVPDLTPTIQQFSFWQNPRI
jgi:hypothetical protein